MPAAPTAGRRNCSRCSRWRSVIDFPPGRTRRRDGSVIDPPQLSSWCEACRRAAARARAAERYTDRRRDLLRIKRGEALRTPPFRRWCEERAEAVGWAQVAEWAGVDPSNLRRALKGYAIDYGLVDRALAGAWEPEAMNDLYPLPELAAA